MEHYAKMGKLIAPIIESTGLVFQRVPLRESIFIMREHGGYCGVCHGELRVNAEYSVQGNVRRFVAFGRSPHDAGEDARNLALDLPPMSHRAAKLFKKEVFLRFRRKVVGEFSH
jgi:hypothetical protein